MRKKGLLVFEISIGKEFRAQVLKNVIQNITADGKFRITIKKI